MLFRSQVSIIGRGTDEKLSARRDKTHVLYGGTKILQHTPDKVVYPNHVNLNFLLFDVHDGNPVFFVTCSRHFI